MHRTDFGLALHKPAVHHRANRQQQFAGRRQTEGGCSWSAVDRQSVCWFDVKRARRDWHYLTSWLTETIIIGGFKGAGGHGSTNVAPNKFQDRPSGASKMQENLLTAGLYPGPHPWESLQRSLIPSRLWGGAAPSPRTSPRSRFSGFVPRSWPKFPK